MGFFGNRIAHWISVGILGLAPFLVLALLYILLSR